MGGAGTGEGGEVAEELRRAWEALPEEEVRISTGVVCECELVMVDLRHFRIFCWLTAIVMELSAREQQTDGASKHNGASRVGGGGGWGPELVAVPWVGGKSDCF